MAGIYLTEQVSVAVAVMIFIRDVADSILDRVTSYPEVSILVSPSKQIWR